TSGGGLGRIKIEAQDSGEVKVEAEGLTDAGGSLLTGTGLAELKISGNLDGAPVTLDEPLDVVEGRTSFRGSLGLSVGDTFEITSVELIVTDGATLVPGLSSGSGDDDDHDGQGEDGDGDHSLTRDDDEGEGGGYSTTLVKQSGSGGFTFDSAGGAHVS